MSSLFPECRNPCWQSDAVMGLCRIEKNTHIPRTQHPPSAKIAPYRLQETQETHARPPSRSFGPRPGRGPRTTTYSHRTIGERQTTASEPALTSPKQISSEQSISHQLRNPAVRPFVGDFDLRADKLQVFRRCVTAARGTIMSLL